ncbi:hypothetical protein BS614_24000 [Paenibacillus xylanexedens]|uniref:hypothetical protein n=1 Tax=Paenibacillus xylanexedens TaxID=528191 RepID=UPI0009386C18|nr:hypothetical protein [Paenibacillus xylanexedens]APO46802.1 hypothetical protein BS614_24000 [Paenibacillus xylanexedens]
MDPEIKREEILYRALKPIPAWWKDDLPSSAIFKDSNGVSVDRDGGRSTGNITLNFESRMGKENLRAIAIIKVEDCLDNDTVVLHKPVEDNEHHAEIHSSHDKVELTRGQARKLFKCCDFIYFDRNNNEL